MSLTQPNKEASMFWNPIDASASVSRVNESQPTRKLIRLRTPFALAAVFLIYSALAFFRLGWPDLGSDEGRFGISALNILSDHHQVATVSEDPLGGVGTKPYLYPLALAASIAVLGKSEFAVRVVNVIALGLSAFLLFFAIRSAAARDRLAALTFALFLLNPWTITYARIAMPEPLVMCAGCMSLFAAEKWRRTPRRRWAALCGLALGFGYLVKLWLIAPFAGACFVIVFSALFRLGRLKVLASFSAASFVFLFTASTHLLLSAILAPNLFYSWVDLYFLFSLKTRVAGIGYDPGMWFRPWWFYPATVLKASFFGLPLLLVAIEILLRRRLYVVLAVLLALLSPVAIFSVVAVKQASYIYSALPAIALLLATGCLAVWNGEHQKSLLWAVPVFALISGIFFAKQVFSQKELGAIEALCAGYLVLALLKNSVERGAPAVVLSAAAIAMLLGDAAVVKSTLQHRTHYREIAAFLKNDLSGISPRRIAFVAPEYPAMEFYTFRSGEYWETFYKQKSLDSFSDELRRGERVFYVVDQNGNLYGSRMLPGMYKAVEEQTRNITANIVTGDRQELHLQIFENAAGTLTRPR